MKVSYHSALMDKTLVAGQALYVMPTKAVLRLQEERNEPPFQLLCNGTLLDPNTREVSCNGKVELTVAQEGHRLVYAVHPAFSLLSPRYGGAYDQFSYDCANLTTPTIQGIQQGRLKLYAMDQSMDVRDYTEVFDQMESAYSSFKTICERPKSHLRSVNEVRPVETVKRVGYESIPYLAAHSEDWLARTASGLKPARLFSRVEDDDYQIYENRLTKTLIDLILSFLRKTEKELRDQRDQLRGILDSEFQMDSFGFDAGFQKAVVELMAGFGGDDEYRSKRLDLINQLQKRARFLLKRYRTLRQTRMYRYLRKTKPVSNPVNTTNILLMDRHYSVIFKLWKMLHGELISKAGEIEDGYDYDSVCLNYQKYCSVLCEYAAHVLGFELWENGTYQRGADQIGLSVETTVEGWVRVSLFDIEPLSMPLRNGLEVPIQPGTSLYRFEFDGKTLSWPQAISDSEIESFCSMFKTRSSRDKQREERRRYSALKSAIDAVQRRASNRVSNSILIIPAAVELSNDSLTAFRKIMEQMVDKITSSSLDDIVIAALPICNEGEQKVIDYAFNAGQSLSILPLSIFDINSYRRIQIILYRQILRLEKQGCPNCGRKTPIHDSRFCCDECGGLTTTLTKCANPECGNQYHYLSYEPTAPAALESMRTVRRDDFFQWDSLYKYKNIVEMSVSSGKVRSICPWCHQ